MKKLFLLLVLSSSLMAFNCNAQTTVLHNFNSSTGDLPNGSLVLAGNMMYGMKGLGGTNNAGGISKIDTNGNVYNDMLDFNITNGYGPYGSFILSGKVLYGMTDSGGMYGSGCVFSIDTTGRRYKTFLILMDQTGNIHGLHCYWSGINYMV
jgi:uncharacterized repeat protein (TIGR03803 family)